jgi:hypothetical protein
MLAVVAPATDHGACNDGQPRSAQRIEPLSMKKRHQVSLVPFSFLLRLVRLAD